MWCSKCKNAWSWEKGILIHGFIDNPHFFNYYKKMMKYRSPKDDHCDIIPTSYQFYQCKISFTNINRGIRDELIDIYKEYEYILKDIYSVYECLEKEAIEHYKWCLRSRETMKIELRVKYILGQLDDKTFKSEIYKIKIDEEKWITLLHLYDFFRIIIREKILELFNNKNSNDKNDKCKKIIFELKRCEEYVNNEANKIPKTYLWDVDGVWYSKKFYMKHSYKIMKI